MLSNQTVAEEIVKKFGDDVYDFEEPFGLLTLTTTREQIIPMLEYLKNHSDFKISFLTDISVVHFPDTIPDR